MYSCAAHWTQGPCIPVLHTGHKGHVFLCCTLDTRAMYSCAAHWTQGPCIPVLHTGHKGHVFLCCTLDTRAMYSCAAQGPCIHVLHVFMLRCGVFLFVIAQSSMIVGKLWYAHAICSGILCECVCGMCVCSCVCKLWVHTHHTCKIKYTADVHIPLYHILVLGTALCFLLQFVSFFASVHISNVHVLSDRHARHLLTFFFFFSTSTSNTLAVTSYTRGTHSLWHIMWEHALQNR